MHEMQFKINEFVIRILWLKSFSFSLQGFVIRPGHENLVAMGAVDTIAEEAIR